MLDPVTTTLADIQNRLLEIITPRVILVGHSLDSDLKALKMTHPFIIDTAIIYPHPRGPPLKSSLKFLAQKYLNREIQKNHGSKGHDSVEDARACLDLLKQKCEKGPTWGSSEASSEPIFKRLARSARPKNQQMGATEEHRKGAVVDWGDPRRGHGSTADVTVGCASDDEVVQGILRAVNGTLADGDPSIPTSGVDFVWARLRELEAIRGWWSSSKTSDLDDMRLNAMAKAASSSGADDGLSTDNLREAVTRTVDHIKSIYASLPPCTAFIVYTGTGDPRETARLHALHQQHKKEFQTKKWNELSVKWTDAENQALRKAVKKAREGLGFIVVK